MFAQSRQSRALTVDVTEIERRLRALERRLENAGNRVSANASQSVDRVSDLLAAALAEVADRFRGSAGTVGDEARRFGNEAAKLGTDTLRRVSDEVKHRPLVALAVVAGVGILLGLASRRR